MKKLLSSALFLFAMTFIVGAQTTLSVSGHVTDEITGTPIQNHLVIVTVLDSSFYQDYEFYTNDAGFYEGNSIPASSQGVVRAATYDCIGDEHVQDANYSPSVNSFVFDFEICSDSISLGDCQNFFWYDPDTNPNSFTFYGESFPMPANDYLWDFGDGSTGSGQQITHAFDPNQGDNFMVTLTTLSNDPTGDSCIATSSQEIWIGGGTSDCTADFDYTLDSTPTGAYVAQFTDLSVGNPAFWAWDFGDGGFSDEQNPEYTYNTQGTYYVCLTIFSDSMANCFDTYCEQIVVGSGGGSGDCENFFYYIPDSSLNSYTFYGESFPMPADEYYWDFGDGSTGSGQQTTHTFDPNLGDVFMVSLTTIMYYPTGDSCIATSTEEVWIGGGGSGDCTADYTYTLDSVPSGAYVAVFTDQSIGSPANWNWDFGDGSYSEEQNPQHIYDFPGTYFVCLSIYSDSLFSCFDTYCEEIVIGTGGGMGDCENFFWYEPGSPMNTFNFYGEAFPLPADEYYWDFGDGTTGYGQQTSHAFDPGQADVFFVTLTTLTYTNDSLTNDTCFAYTTQEIWVGNSGWDCENWFWYETWDNLTFDFTGESFPFAADEYYWDFGDGATATGSSVSHTYDPNAGDLFMVTLTTFSYDPILGDSCVATSIQDIWVGSQTMDCENFFWYESGNDFEFTFYGESFPLPAAFYNWSFGDGTTATGQVVTHTFDPSAGGQFTVCLETFSYDPATDSCFAVSCQDIYLGGQSGQGLNGTIYLGGDLTADYALVGLFGIANGGSYVYEFTTTEEGTGMYFFNNVPEGEYYIWSALTPQSANFFEYFPTYYGDEIFWFDATLITLDSAANPYDIHMVAIDAITSGPAVITGTVTLEGDGKDGPGDNIMIVLMDENENPVLFIQSDENGNFTFDDIAYGTYKLKVEMPGVSSEIATVYLSEESPTFDLNFYVNSSTAWLSIKNANMLEAVLGEVYPNPVKDYINLEINMQEASNLQIRIIDIRGNVLIQSPLNTSPGSNQAKLNTSELSQGMYFLEISDVEGNSLTKKFIK